MRIISLFLFLSQCCISQEMKLNVDTTYINFDTQNLSFGKSCEDGTKSATADFNKGIYNYFSYGWSHAISTADKKRYKKICSYLKSKYALNYEYKGCILDDESDCYSKTMIRMIEEKFGDGFIDRKLEEAKKIYPQK